MYLKLSKCSRSDNKLVW